MFACSELYSRCVNDFIGNQDWIIYNPVCRGRRREPWMTYFDHVDVLIFLCPISAFDEMLEGDPTVNRLEDSILLWKTICASVHLRYASIILIFNKMDILRTKLAAGVHIRDYVGSYGDRPNNAETFASYVKSYHKNILFRHSPTKRTFYCYEISAVTPGLTSAIISNVRNVILTKNLHAIVKDLD